MKITSSEVKLRDRGHNLGILMPHYNLSGLPGSKTVEITERIAFETLSGHTGNGWVCLVTDSSGIPSGIGSLINGLKECGLDVDLHVLKPIINGNSSSSPSWINKPKTVVVNYSEEGNLHYYSLGKNDVIAFEKPEDNSTDLENVFEYLNLVPSTKWIFTEEADNKDYLQLLKDNQRSRMSWVS